MTSSTTVDIAAVRDLAPRGTLRAAINFGNSVLAQGDGDQPHGVAVDLAHQLGERLGVEVEFVMFDAAGKVVEAVKDDAWDIAFLAIDAKRAGEIVFTSPYVLIEGSYMVPQASTMTRSDEVDRPGIRVGAGRGSAYELFLSRTLKFAQIERLPTARKAFDLVDRGELPVAAGVRQVVDRYAREHGAMRLLDPSYMVIEQAIGAPVGRSAPAFTFCKPSLKNTRPTASLPRRCGAARRAMPPWLQRSRGSQDCKGICHADSPDIDRRRPRCRGDQALRQGSGAHGAPDAGSAARHDPRIRTPGAGRVLGRR
jgi:polar amino acid transport system substrate-binding protein